MARLGRPRSFDREEALERAVDVFRRYGYEGATLVDLQEAMGGIAAPSLYAAFGSKEDLFKEVVGRYVRTSGAAAIRGLTEQPTARAAIHAVLRDSVTGFTKPGQPRGCLLVVGAINSAHASGDIQECLRQFRGQTQRDIAQRIRQGVQEGDLPSGTNVSTLTSFYMSFLHGLSIQARDGASRASLLAAVECAMSAWDGLVAAAYPGPTPASA
jgi:AcrR family transcriptional regulator